MRAGGLQFRREPQRGRPILAGITDEKTAGRHGLRHRTGFRRIGRGVVSLTLLPALGEFGHEGDGVQRQHLGFAAEAGEESDQGRIGFRVGVDQIL
jgi:hypothetical protein